MHRQRAPSDVSSVQRPVAIVGEISGEKVAMYKGDSEFKVFQDLYNREASP